MTISELARSVGLKPSAIRYYESIGLLRPPLRRSGRRSYDRTALYRLALLQRARAAGFTLDEIRQLFFGSSSRASERWKKFSQRKIAELDAAIEGIRAMRGVLVRISGNCRCETLDECGKRIFERTVRAAEVSFSAKSEAWE